MIVRRLEAENLLCYRRLWLGGLPERGLIGVSGDNEAGKSAIGEVLCFALFGRTFAVGAADLGAIVRWGAPRGSVLLRLRLAGQDYEVRRELAADGRQSARLALVDSAGEPLARGAEAVNERLCALLGLGFAQYLETFYLAQHELTTPQPHGSALREMAGIGPHLACAQVLRAEAAVADDERRRAEQRLAQIDVELKGLAEGQPPIDGLEQELTEIQRRTHNQAGLLQALDEAVAAYASAAERAPAEGLQRGLVGLASSVLLLAAILAGGLWVLLRWGPEVWPMPALRDWLTGLAAPLGVAAEATLVYGVILVAGLLALLAVWRLTLGLGERRRLARGRRLAEVLERIDELDHDAGIRVGPVSIERLESGQVSVQPAALVDRPDSERRLRLAQRVLALAASAKEVRAAQAHERAWLEHLSRELAARREGLSAALAGARHARERSQVLAAELAEVRAALAEQAQRYGTSTLAAELLAEYGRRAWERFAERVEAGASRLLPRLTDGAYEHLQLDEELRIRLYSPGKHGFLEAGETSGGTQRQVMLALRLALAGDLAARAGRVGGQLVFLDEPFAFFDDTRVRGALAALRDDPALAQVWVVAQRFPPDAGLALEIHCARHLDSLELGAPATSP